MPSTIFFEGQIPIQEGFFLRLAARTPILNTLVGTGTVAALIIGERGPLSTIVSIDNLAEVTTRFGTGLGPNVVTQALYGGAPLVKTLRVGAGGTKASRAFTNTTPTTAFTMTAVDPGTDGNLITVTIQANPSNALNRQLLIYRSAVLQETIDFLAGAAGTGEPQLAVAAINAQSKIVTAVFGADGTKILTLTSAVPLASGASVTTAAGDWTTALALLNAETFNLLAVSTEDTGIWASISAQLNTWHDDGKYIECVVGQSVATTPTEAARVTNIKALANYHMRGVVNGFTQDATTYEGAQAAGRVVGEIAGRRVTQGITSARIAGATAVVNPGADFDNITSSGVLGFRTSPDGTVLLSRDVTTLYAPVAPLDSGWKYGRNVRQRLNFFARLLVLRGQIVGQSGNDEGGRSVATAAFTNLIDDMIREGAFESGDVQEDAANPPSGGTAYWNINFKDIGSLDQVLITVGIES